MQETNEKPDIAEMYTSATHTSNLRVEAEIRGQADMIIAAGMSPSRLGSALLRLHSEFDGASKPSGKATQTDATLLMINLKSLPGVREQLLIIAGRLGMDGVVVPAVLHWWLYRTCHVCHGTELELTEKGPTGRVCKACRGSGESLLPYGEAGKKMLNYIDDALNAARFSIKRKLRG